MKYIYNHGTNKDNSTYGYFGGANDRGTWNELGAIWWEDDDSMFFGEWKDGDHHGVGLSLRANGERVLSNYTGWDYDGPTILFNDDFALFVNASKGLFNGKSYYFKKGRNVEIITYDNGKIVDREETDHFIDFDFTPKFHPRFKVTNTLETVHSGKGDDAYVSYVGKRDGYFDGLGATIWNDQRHVGMYANGKRNGFGCYKWDNDGSYHFATWRNGDKTDDPYIRYSKEKKTISISCIAHGKNYVLLYAFDGSMQINTYSLSDYEFEECIEITSGGRSGSSSDYEDDDDDSASSTSDIMGDLMHGRGGRGKSSNDVESLIISFNRKFRK